MAGNKIPVNKIQKAPVTRGGFLVYQISLEALR